MMPHTVPKRPMNGVTDAGGGQPGHAFFDASDFFGRRQLHVYGNCAEDFSVEGGVMPGAAPTWV